MYRFLFITLLTSLILTSCSARQDQTTTIPIQSPDTPRSSPTTSGSKLEMAREAFLKHPLDNDIVIKYAHLLLKHHQPAKARDILAQLAQVHPQDSLILREYGIALSRNLAFDDAERVFLQALALDDHDPLLYFNLAGLYQNERLLDKAVTNFQKALELKPDFIEAKLYLETVQDMKAKNLGTD